MNGIADRMRIFVDSNVLISAILSKSSLSSILLRIIIEKHRLLICSFSILEISKVLERKFPNQLRYWDDFLTSLDFELIYTPDDSSSFNSPDIRDPEDLPIIISLLIAKPDIFITGDSDFFTKELRERFVIYTPSEFLNYFGYI